jgi:hypothetical protein
LRPGRPSVDSYCRSHLRRVGITQPLCGKRIDAP